MEGKDPRPPKQLHKKAAKKDDVIDAEATEIQEPASDSASAPASEASAVSSEPQQKKPESTESPKSAADELADNEKKDPQDK